MEIDMNYWVVGATWGSDNLADRFYLRGCWEMGWEEGDKATYERRVNNIKAGDRVAIKKMDGHGATTICIIAIGVVKDVDGGKVYIDWLVKNMDRHVPCKNYFGTIHGPVEDDLWRNSAFCL